MKNIFRLEIFLAEFLSAGNIFVSGYPWNTLRTACGVISMAPVLIRVQ